MMGFGIASGLGSGVGAAVAPEVERLGYGSFWVTDGRETPGLPILAAAQKVTRGLRLGTGVIPVDARPAGDIETSVRDLRLDLGRLVLGIGSGRAENRIEAVRSAARDLRAALGPSVVLCVAALGPQVLRLAGEIADVVQPNWMLPSRIEWAKRRVAEGERRAGRAPGTVKMAMYVRVAIGEGAAEVLAAEAGRYARSPSYTRHFTAMGVQPGEVGIASRDGRDVRARLEPYTRVLDETIVRALPATSSADEVIAIARAGAGR